MGNSSRWWSSGFLVALCAVALAPGRVMADPVIGALSTPQIPLNSFLTIYGSGFGLAQGTSMVTIGSSLVPVQAWADDAIHVYVSLSAPGGGPVALNAVYPVVVQVDGKTSNVMNVTVTSGPPLVYPVYPGPETPTDQPSVRGFQTTSFCPGNVIAVYGAAFGDSQGAGFVSVTVPLLDAHGNPFTQEYQMPVLAWSNNAVEALLSLPVGAQPGSYTLTVHRDNGKSASASLTVSAMCD